MALLRSCAEAASSQPAKFNSVAASRGTPSAAGKLATSSSASPDSATTISACGSAVSSVSSVLSLMR